MQEMAHRAMNTYHTHRIQFCEIWWAEAGLMGSQEDISSELTRKSWPEIATKILVCMTSVVTMKFSAHFFSFSIIYQPFFQILYALIVSLCLGRRFLCLKSAHTSFFYNGQTRSVKSSLSACHLAWFIEHVPSGSEGLVWGQAKGHQWAYP